MRADRRRGGGRGDRDRPPRRAADRRRARPGSCTAPSRRSCRTRTARSSRRTRSRPGLDYPGSGPEHAWLRDQGRARYVAITDAQALDAFARTARLEGIIPALESSHALAWALAHPDSELDLICLSGRGDKDLAEALEALSAPGRATADRGRAATGIERIAEAFARARADGRRAALMPYLMGGYPDLETSRAIGAGLRRRRRRPGRAGGAVLGPARRRAGDPRRRHRGADAAGATLPAVLEVARDDRRPRSRWCSCATPTRSSPAGWSASSTRWSPRASAG